MFKCLTVSISTMLLAAPLVGFASPAHQYACWATFQKYDQHHLVLRQRGGRVASLLYTSINLGNANTCEIRARVGDKQSSWSAYGPLQLVSIPDDVSGEVSVIALIRHPRSYSLHILEQDPGACGLQDMLESTARLAFGNGVCRLSDEDDTPFHHSLLYDGKVKVGHFLPSGSHIIQSELVDFNKGIVADPVATYHPGPHGYVPTGLFIGEAKRIVHKGGVDFPFIPLFHYVGGPMLLRKLRTGPPDAPPRKTISLTEFRKHSVWSGTIADRQGAVRVEHETMTPNARPAVHTYRDFVRRRGRRENDATHTSTRFRLLLATPRASTPPPAGGHASARWASAPTITVRRRAFVYYHPKHWHGPKDLSFSAQAQWDAKNLYLRVRVTDNHVVQPFNGDKMLDGDHIELWVGASHPRQFAISALARPGDAQAIRQWYPKAQAGPVPGATAHGHRTSDGYVVQAKLPLAVLGIKAPAAGAVFTRHTRPVPFTLVVSDTDNAKSPRQDKAMASSQLKWGRPQSFGELYLVHHAGLPLFEANSRLRAQHKQH